MTRPARHRIRTLATTVTTLVVAGSALSACGSEAESATADGPTVTVTDARGETEVPLEPQEVVVFDMGVLDTIDTLGAADAVAAVPQDFLPDYLQTYAADGVEDAGTLFEPDYEAVDALQPDLIVVAGRSAEAYDDLSEIAPTLDLTLDTEDLVGSLEQQTQTIATVLGEEEAAQEALDALDAKVASVREQTASAGSGLVVLTTGGELSAYGSGSRFGAVVHDLLGVEPADADIEADTHGESVTFEYVAETDPDWLFVVDRDAATGESDGGAAEAVLDNELVAGTTAWQEDQVVHLDPVTWYVVGSGLTAFGDMVDQVAESVR